MKVCDTKYHARDCSLSNEERETIINFDEKNKTSNIYSHNRRILSKLEKAYKERPDECIKINDNEYEVPKKWIKVSPPRTMSEEQRKIVSERLASFRNKKVGAFTP